MSLEAEQSVIGAILLRPESFDRVAEIINPDDFTDVRHTWVMLAAEKLRSESKPVDVITVCDLISSQGRVPDLGYFVEITKSLPSIANIEAYAAVVRDKRVERDLIQKANDMAGIVYGDGSTSEKIEKITTLVAGIGEEASGDVRIAGTIVKSAIELWQKRLDNNGALMGYSTGFADIDIRTMGLQAPDLWVIAAGSGKGKTTFAMNMVQAVGIQQHKPVLVFSLEMSGEQIIDRLMASTGRIPLQLIKSGKMFESEYQSAIAPTADKIKNANIYVDDRPGLSIGQIKAGARKFFRKHGEGLLVVDYIGLVSGAGNSKEERTASVSGAMKGIAKELNIPVVALAQINRNSVARSEKRPVASDLRDSAAIEHDSDILIMLHEDEAINPGTMEANFVKHRNGECGVDYLTKRLDINRFEDQAKGFRPEQQKRGTAFEYES